MKLEIVRRLPFGLRVSVDGAESTVWVNAKLRKSRRCELCKREMKSGEMAWRTVENALYRAARVGTCCWEHNGSEESDGESQREEDDGAEGI